MPRSKNSETSGSPEKKPSDSSSREGRKRLMLSRKLTPEERSALGVGSRRELVISPHRREHLRRSTVTDPPNSDETLSKDSKQEKPK